MKIKEKINAKKIVTESKKNHAQLTNLFSHLKTGDLSKEDKEDILEQLDELESLALAIKAKL